MGSIVPNGNKTEEAVTHDIGQEIGEFVRSRRKAGGLSQRELGELAGVGTRFVSELERGKPTVRLDAVNKVVAVFGKTLGLVDAPKQDEGP
jgi:y4mF family transcriptional regulator